MSDWQGTGNRNGHLWLAIGKPILQLYLLYGEPVLLRTLLKVWWSSGGHSHCIAILYTIAIRD
jgi:hypothetical protein